MKNNPIHIVFSGGGTGGHLFPGLAVAERLAAAVPRARITFCGGGKPFERKAVSQSGFDYFVLPARPMPRGPCEAVSFVIENLASYIAAQRFLREENVATVVGLGGYVSVPMARAAARRGVPLVLLEQNVIPGKATRWLAHRASLVCTSYAQTAEHLRGNCPVRETGNPVRYGFSGQGSEEGERGEKEVASGKWLVASAGNQKFLAPSSLSPSLSSLSTIHYPLSTLLVLGGSGGARALNENVPRALYKVRSQLTNWRILHQSGEADLDVTRSLYAKFDLPAVVHPFLAEMPKILAKTDLAVCRAGGTTLAELAASGVPAVLLPYPHATDDHQAANARHFAAGGGCVTIDQREVEGRLDDELAEKICFLLANDGLRARMAAAMNELARPDAAADIADLVWSIASSQAVRELSAVA